MRWLDGITDSMDRSLSKVREVVKDGGLACCSAWTQPRVAEQQRRCSALRSCAQMCVQLRPARRTAERSQISRRDEESWAWEGATGPGSLLKGDPALLALPARACGLTPRTPSLAVTATAGVCELLWVPGSPPGRMKSQCRPCLRTMSAAPTLPLESRQREAQLRSPQTDPVCLRGACFACPRIPARLWEPRQVWSDPV